MTDVALYWLRECHIDGWRLDVGDEIGHRFWKRFRENIKAEFPEALIIGEVWHHAGDFLQGDEWDTVMNYHFYQQVLGLIWGNIPVSRFVGGLNFLRGQLHPGVTPRLWNLIGSHDTPRILAHCGGDKRRMKLAAALQLLYPGMPMIYYGDEYAMDGGQDPDCRRGMVWDKKRQDGDMFRWYQRLLRLRRERPALLQRDYTEETDDDRALLIRRCGDCSAVFCCGERGIALPEFMGRTDLISGERFAGEAEGFSVLLFAEE